MSVAPTPAEQAYIDLVTAIPPIPTSQTDVDRYHRAFAQSRSHRLAITPAMLAAGRAAFKRKRKLIDDLWQAFDCDIDTAIRDIYRSMARVSE